MVSRFRGVLSHIEFLHMRRRKNRRWPSNKLLYGKAIMFYLIKNNVLAVKLDVAAADDQLPSVAFNINIDWKMPFQRVSIEVKECWLQCSEIDSFLVELKSLIKKDGGELTLHDLSQNPVLCLIKSGSVLITTLFAQDTSNVGKTVLEVTGYPNELEEIQANLESFEKWW